MKKESLFLLALSFIIGTCALTACDISMVSPLEGSVIESLFEESSPKESSSEENSSEENSPEESSPEESDSSEEPVHQHALATKYSVAAGETICADGGFAITYCTECNDVIETNWVEAIGHHSLEWKVETKPTLTTAGLLKGTCNGCDIYVNGETYIGCGEEVTYVLPKLNAVDENGNPVYEVTDKKQTDCSVKGTATYSITIDGQKFDFEEEIPAKNHSIKTSDGNSEQIKANSKIDVNDAKYAGSWTLLHGQNVDCANEDGAQAYFICTECNAIIVVMIITKAHTRPETGIVFEPAGYDPNKVDTLKYNCAQCNTAVTEKIGHKYEYEMVESGDKFFLKTTCSHKFGDVECTYAYTDTTPLKNVEKTVDEEATCAKEGKGHYTYVKDGETLTLNFTIDKIPHVFEGEEFWGGDMVNATTHPNIKPVETGASVPCEGILGVFMCEMCGRVVDVNLYAEHVKDTTKASKDATCAVAGYYYCTVCKALIDDTKDESLKQLAHEYEYTYVSGIEESADKYVIKYDCRYCEADDVVDVNGNMSTVTKGIDKSLCKADIIIKPSCTEEGRLLISVYKDTTKEELNYQVTAVLAKTYHVLTIDGKKTEIVDTVYSYNKANMKLVDTGKGTPSCSSSDSAYAVFTCEVCGYHACGIKVRTAHTKPADANEITTVAPTYTTEGYDEWVCQICGESCCRDNFVAPLEYNSGYSATDISCIQDIDVRALPCVDTKNRRI